MSRKNFKINHLFSISLSDNLKKLRESKEITLKQFANNIGIGFDMARNYENNAIIPPLKTLIAIAYYFKVSVDFLLFWDKTPYVYSLRLLSLAEEIDKLDQNKRYQIESTSAALLKGKNLDVQTKLDNTNTMLTDNFHSNFKKLREEKELTQQAIANTLNLTRGQIGFYEHKSFPRPERLFKISELFDISVHALCTGYKLDFSFRDHHLKKIILKADKLLTLKEKEFFCHLMDQVLMEDSSSIRHSG